jgi:hypothetical protein
MDEATELEWLKYFVQWADFGPAHSDVVHDMQARFEQSTGKRVPSNWRDE